MSKVVVTFVGICTHIEKVPITPPGDAVHGRCLPFGRYRRTVMVNGRNGLHLRTRGMNRHEALLVIPKDFLADPHLRDLPGLKRVEKKKEEDKKGCAYWQMEGVRLYVPEAKGNLEIGPSFGMLPSLTECAGVLSLQLDERVVQEGRAAAVFDIFAGELDAYRQEQSDAVWGTLTVQTESANPELSVTEVWSDRRSTIALKSDAYGRSPQVFVQNVACEVDQDIDFILHYHTTTWTPPPGQWPQPCDLSRVRLATDEENGEICPPFSGLSVGCSNSIYP